MAAKFNSVKIIQGKEQLVNQCIQQLLVDSLDTVTMNYLKNSAPYLIPLFGNQKLYIFALNEDDANKELNVHLFVIPPSLESEVNIIILE